MVLQHLWYYSELIIVCINSKHIHDSVAIATHTSSSVGKIGEACSTTVSASGST